MEDHEVEAVFAELQRRRAELAASVPAEVSVSDFAVTVLGGAWTRAHRGVVADAMQGHAVGQSAKDFCRRRGVPQSARFELSLYSPPHAGVMARGWAHRMQHFMTLEVAARDEAHVFTADEISSYTEPTEFVQVSEVFRGHAQATKRFRAIRSLFAS